MRKNRESIWEPSVPADTDVVLEDAVPICEPAVKYIALTGLSSPKYKVYIYPGEEVPLKYLSRTALAQLVKENAIKEVRGE